MSDRSAAIDAIKTRLGAVKSSARRLFICDGLGRMLTAVSIFIVVTFFLDWWLRLPDYVRLLFLGGGALMILYIIGRRMVYPLAASISDDDVSVFLERKYPDLNDRLISAIQLARPTGEGREFEQMTNSPVLVDALIAETAGAIRTIDFHAVVTRRYVMKTLLWGFLISGAIALAAASDQNGYASIYFQRLLGRDVRWPQLTTLEIEDADFRDKREKVIARGSDLFVSFRASGSIPTKVIVKILPADGSEEIRKTLIKSGDRFTHRFDKVPGPFTFHAEGGDAATDNYAVKTLTPPEIDNVRHFCAYPPYLKMAPTPRDRPIEGGNVNAPVFSAISVEAASNEELESGVLVLIKKNGEEVRTDAKVSGRNVSGALTVTGEHEKYAFHVTAKNGLTNRNPVTYTIKAAVDKPPEIRINDPLGDEYVTNVAVRPMSLTTIDDFGVREIALVHKIATQPDAKEVSVVFGPVENTPPDYGGREIKTASNFDVSRLKVKQGDVIEYYFTAVDYKDTGGTNLTTTKKRRFTVVSHSQLQNILEAELNNIKDRLRKLKARQELQKTRTDDVRRKFGALDQLTYDQKGEMKNVELEQNNITQNLDKIRKDILRILQQGTYNKIFDETSLKKIGAVLEIVSGLSGLPGDDANPGKSTLAGVALRAGYHADQGPVRAGALDQASVIEQEIVDDIAAALEKLEEWATYQEVIRITREILEDQEKVNEGIKQTVK